MPQVLTVSLNVHDASPSSPLPDLLSIKWGVNRWAAPKRHAPTEYVQRVAINELKQRASAMTVGLSVSFIQLASTILANSKSRKAEDCLTMHGTPVQSTP